MSRIDTVRTKLHNPIIRGNIPRNIIFIHGIKLTKNQISLRKFMLQHKFKVRFLCCCINRICYLVHHNTALWWNYIKAKKKMQADSTLAHFCNYNGSPSTPMLGASREPQDFPTG